MAKGLKKKSDLELTTAERAAVLRAIAELDGKSSQKAVRKSAESILGAPEGSLDAKKAAIKEVCQEEMNRLEQQKPPKKQKRKKATLGAEGGAEDDDEAPAEYVPKKPKVKPVSKDGQAERTGKFSKAESAEVMQAAEDEAKSRGVTVSQMVEKSDWGRGDKNPWRAIAEKFPQRSARSILGHVKRNGHSGAKQKGVRWTVGESQALKEAFDKNPSDWTQIAQGFDRTPGACRDRYRTLFGEVPAKGTPHSEAKEVKSGNWGADEDNRLRNCKSKNGRPVCKEVDPETISFSDVARAVKTRSRLQCRRRWAELRGPAAPPSKKLDSASEKLSLCEALKASGATDESDVTWTSLGWDVPGAATACALSTWKRLKKAHGGGDDADFQEALDAVTSELQAEVDGGAD